MPRDVKALEEQIVEIVSQAGREFYAPAFSSSILVGLVKPFILPLFPLQLTINERQPAAPNIPILPPYHLNGKQREGRSGRAQPARPSAGAFACNCQSSSDFRRRAETNLARRGGTALPGKEKSAMTRASSPGRRGDRSTDESENANTREVNLNRRIFSGVGAATTCCYFSRSQAPNIAMKCRCV
jgi:general stress protein YciG